MLTIHHVFSVNLPADVEAKFVGLLNQILERVNSMPTQADFAAAQAAEDVKIAALIAAFTAAQANIAALTAAAAAAAGDPVALQAAIDDATKQGAAIDAALGTVVPPVVAPVTVANP